MDRVDNLDVFINCPFTPDYKDKFYALIYCIVRCGFKPRCSREVFDNATNRIDAISKIIKECNYGIHDISETSLDTKNGLPRFNMPLELGLFMGAIKFAETPISNKKALILDIEPYRYQKFISDISGQDISVYDATVNGLIDTVSRWLRNYKNTAPGGALISREYEEYNTNIPQLCAASGLDVNELTYSDQLRYMTEWIVSD